MVNAPINEGQNWEELRERTRANVLRKLGGILGHSIEDLIEEEDYTDPVRMEALYSGKQGSIYGNSSNSRMAAFYRHPNFSPKIKGLYFTGVTVHPGGGIPLALNSAKIIEKCIREDFKII
jgi:phytoene dehydrogenase-like protein